jgi:hypothetical protein
MVKLLMKQKESLGGSEDGIENSFGQFFLPEGKFIKYFIVKVY